MSARVLGEHRNFRKIVYPCQSPAIFYARSQPATRAFASGMLAYVEDHAHEAEARVYQLEAGVGLVTVLVYQLVPAPPKYPATLHCTFQYLAQGYEHLINTGLR